MPPPAATGCTVSAPHEVARRRTHARTLAWALWLVGASRTVKRLRGGREPGTPLAPAAAGALLAWALAGDPTALPLPTVALALLLAALALAALLPMMAALPAVADWCGASGWPPRAVTAAHLHLHP